MIKVIAFDLVGVLVREKDIELSDQEDKLERLFGPNLSDKEYLSLARKYAKEEEIIDITNNIINKLYEVKNKDLINSIREKYTNIKIIVATNHVSYVRKYIENNIKNIDDIIISAEINRIKPNEDFYNYILNKYKLKPQELLFIDDNQHNIDGANKLKIETIKVDKDTNLIDSIIHKIDK